MSRHIILTAVLFTVLLSISLSAANKKSAGRPTSEEVLKEAENYALAWLNPDPKADKQIGKSLDKIKRHFQDLDPDKRENIAKIVRSKDGPLEKGRKIARTMMADSPLTSVLETIQVIHQQTETILERQDCLIDPENVSEVPVKEYESILGEDIDDYHEAQSQLKSSLYRLEKEIAFPTYEVDSRLMLVTSYMRRLARLGDRLVKHLDELRDTTRKKTHQLKTLVEQRMQNKLRYTPVDKRKDLLEQELASSSEIIKAISRFEAAKDQTKAALFEVAFKIRKLSDVANTLALKRMEIRTKADVSAIEKVTDVMMADLKAIDIDDVLDNESLNIASDDANNADNSTLSARQVLDFLNEK
ncbi:hypothetical protein ACFL3Q_03525 [Planctomycetota bacterium]